MFSNGYVTWLVCQERNKDRLREAEQYRLVRQALAGHGRSGRVLARVATSLGCYLIVCGQCLQQRYGVPTDSPVLCGANGAGN